MGRIYESVVTSLERLLRANAEVFAFYGSNDTAHDMVMQFLDAMVLGETVVRPERMQSLSILGKELRKYGSHQNNICGYEIHEVLGDVLHELEYDAVNAPRMRVRNSGGRAKRVPPLLWLHCECWRGTSELGFHRRRAREGAIANLIVASAVSSKTFEIFQAKIGFSWKIDGMVTYILWID